MVWEIKKGGSAAFLSISVPYSSSAVSLPVNLKSSSSSLFDMLPTQFSPTLTVSSASSLYDWMSWSIFSTKVFFVMKRWTITLLCCPIR